MLVARWRESEIAKDTEFDGGPASAKGIGRQTRRGESERETEREGVRETETYSGQYHYRHYNHYHLRRHHCEQSFWLKNRCGRVVASMPEAGDVGIACRPPIPVREFPFRPPGMPAMWPAFPRDADRAPTTPIRRLAPRRRAEAPGSPNVATPPEELAAATSGTDYCDVDWDPDDVSLQESDAPDGDAVLEEVPQAPASGSAAADPREVADHSASRAEAPPQSDQPRGKGGGDRSKN